MATQGLDDDIVYKACTLCKDFEYRGRFYGNEESKGATTAKILGILTILALTVFGIFLRMKFPSLAYSKASSYLQVFSGGMFVSLALFFLLPSAAVQYPEGLFGDVPWIFVSCIGGFLAVLLNERILFNTHAASVAHPIWVEEGEEVVVEYGQNKGGEFEDAPEDPQGNGWGVLLLVLAMSIQSIFEGSIVTTAHTAGSVWLSTFMVSMHRMSSAFSLAARLEDQRIRRRVSFVLLTLFTLSTPIGAAIGWVIDAFSSAGALLPLFNAFAAGTLLYFGFAEIVAEEFQQKKGRWWRFLVFCMGIALVLLLTWVHNEAEMDMSADHAFMTFCKVSYLRCQKRLHIGDEPVAPAIPQNPDALPAKSAPDATPAKGEEEKAGSDADALKSELDKLPEQVKDKLKGTVPGFNDILEKAKNAGEQPPVNNATTLL